MASLASELVVGEIIEIKYRVPRPAVGGLDEAQFSDRWIVAEIIHQDDDALPIARLADGQITDIRSYMTWRRVGRASESDFPRAGH